MLLLRRLQTTLCLLLVLVCSTALAVEEGDMRWNNWDILTGDNSQDDDDSWMDEEEEMYG